MKRQGFTIIEILVTFWILSFLTALLLPSMSKARDAAKVNVSKNNIRNIYRANQNYNAAWKGRQFTGCPDDLAKHGESVSKCIQGYLEDVGAYGGGDDGWVPGPGVQFGETRQGTIVFPGNVPEYIIPYLWASGPCSTSQGAARYGTFLHPNTRQIAEYMEDNIVNKAYFAPKDTIILDNLKDCFNSPGNLCPGMQGEWGGGHGSFHVNKFSNYGWGPAIPMVSYHYAPTNMMNPLVWSCYPNHEDGGFKDPCTFNTGFKAPTLEQAKYGSMKGYLIESHWLQNVTGEACSPTWVNVPETGNLAWRNTNNENGWHWDGCYPALFNHSFRSEPVTCFIDGHVDLLDIDDCDKADNIVAAENEARYGSDNLCGLWNRNTPDGDDGYWLKAAADWIDVSPVTHTEGGIHGRDDPKGLVTAR